MTRPTFDPGVYETPELAEINRPLHDLSWDNIEAQRAYRVLSSRDPSISSAHDRVMKTQAAYKVALEIADQQEAEYLARREAAQPAAIEDDSQINLI